MFDSLSTRLQDVFKSLRGEARLTPENIEAALREIRLALLEADVNFKVVKAFVDRVRDRAMEQDVLAEPVAVAAGRQDRPRRDAGALRRRRRRAARRRRKRPRVILLLGLQGAGKTTTAGKLAKWLAKQGRHPLLVSTDVQAAGGHPAAERRRRSRPACACTIRPARWIRWRARRARSPRRRTSGSTSVIVDTAGRLHIDDELMTELVAIKAATEPTDLLYVADAMTGQDAIKSAGEFNRRVGVTGVVLTKLDGDARGGAALSVVSVVGVPIAFVGSGERLEDLEPFHPDRVVSRVLGHGRRAVAHRDAPKRRSTSRTRRSSKRRSGSNEFTLEDFRDQLKTIRKMGPLEQIMGMLPGMGNIKALAENKPDEKQIARVEAIISSMTPRRAAEAAHHQRQPPEADREGQRHVGRRSESSAEAVRADAEDVEVARRDGRAVGGGGKRRAAAAMQMLREPRVEHADWISEASEGVADSRRADLDRSDAVERVSEETDGRNSFASGRSKKRPFFRVVVTDSRAARDSSFVGNPRPLQPAHQAGVVRRSKGARRLLDRARARSRRTRCGR